MGEVLEGFYFPKGQAKFPLGGYIAIGFVVGQRFTFGQQATAFDVREVIDKTLGANGQACCAIKAEDAGQTTIYFVE